ncbi:hypothetical protein Premu_0736 [Hallella multisaccharivorax DSM 17128]|uniref:Uncharacterized protein n=1 Tax=Hallella multisaccharivorax DSM 17128 TaxID=688246 RepID=F8N6I5_9BACT|nr:hypothetical protein Premu_0736 [Hallella multisaccharivorax DSM 17128]
MNQGKYIFSQLTDFLSAYAKFRGRATQKILNTLYMKR